jgi:hypothetical protein
VIRELTSAFEILPAIDLRGGRVVRLEQGDFDRETAFSDDPVAVATTFADAGARWLHVVDLDGARSGSPMHAPLVRDIAAAVGDRLSVEVAGGLRTQAAVEDVLHAGAARVVVGTAAPCTGLPDRAPSRSTTCSQRAPADANDTATATGSSEKAVSRSKSPCSSRTTRPPRRSMAGRIANVLVKSCITVLAF